MAWSDPSPRTRVRSPAGAPFAQPGYGSERVSFGRIFFRMVLAGVVGVIGCVAAASIVATLRGHGPHASGTDIALALAVGAVLAWLAWRFVANRPASHGLSARVRDGGWNWRDRDDDAFRDSVDAIVAVDAVSGLVEVVVDVAGDVLTDL